MKEAIEQLIYKIENEGDLTYVAENWPELFEAVGLKDEAYQLATVARTLEHRIEEIAEEHEVDF